MSAEHKMDVLVVDDEKTVRDFFVRFLGKKGISVGVAQDGFAAIEEVKRRKFNLAFLDINMPTMSGVETFGELRKIDPGLKCVFMTGYAPPPDLCEVTREPQIQCLRKPFENLREIEEILDRASQSATN